MKEQPTKRPLFQLGKCSMTHAAKEFLAEFNVDPTVLLSRHQRGDWGEVSKLDVVINDEAVKSGDRILSGYCIAPEGTCTPHHKCRGMQQKVVEKYDCYHMVYVVTIQVPERERRTVLALLNEI